MTKIFDLVHLNGQMYGVDKSTKPLIGDYVFLEFIGSPKDNEVYKLTDKTLDEGLKIVMSSDPSLNLSLLPKIGWQQIRYEDSHIRQAIIVASNWNTVTNDRIDKYLESISPKPKQVEVEMEESYQIFSSFDGWTTEIKAVYDTKRSEDKRLLTIPTVDEKGFVKVKRWIY